MRAPDRGAYTGPVTAPGEPTIHRGLSGVVADATAISHADPAAPALTYRGYPVEDLAARCRYEEVAHLLWTGELPTPAEAAAFAARERAARDLGPAVAAALAALSATAHPMDALRTALSADGAAWAAAAGAGAGHDAAMRLLAVTPTVVAHTARRRAGLPPIPPDPTLGLAANLLQMCFGAAQPDIAAAFEASLILYAELGFNASAFTARTVASTGADLHAAVVAAVAALAGPLHGGANEQVWTMMRTIGDPAAAPGWLRAQLAARRRVMGFGHRVYRRRDPRAAPMRRALGEVAAVRDGERWVHMHDALVDAMAAERGIPPNIDLAAGPAYHLMGFDTALFTPLFAVGRMAGWTAHAREQRDVTRTIIHPLAAYAGAPPREVPT